MSELNIIDCNYIIPEAMSSYLLVEEDRAAFVEVNTNYAIPRLKEALDERGMTPEQVDFIILTHVHLDHAGGAGLMMRECPNATLLVHPKGARHMINPRILIHSAVSVYGEAYVQKMYGEILNVDEDRVRSMEDGESVEFGNRTFTFYHTRGHADHHMVIHDSLTNGVFTGDSFGVSYPPLSGQTDFIYPSTSPTDYHPEEAIHSIKRILDLQPECLYLTHFGRYDNPRRAADSLLPYLEYYRTLYYGVVESDSENAEELVNDVFEKIKDFGYRRYEEEVGESPGELGRNIFHLDLTLNAQGIVHSAIKERKAQKSGRKRS